MIPVTYRIVRFEFDAGDRYVGIAWNYDHAALVSTSDCDTYTEARACLEASCAQLGLTLRWFDGSYVRTPGSDAMVPCDRTHS